MTSINLEPKCVKVRGQVFPDKHSTAMIDSNLIVNILVACNDFAMIFQSSTLQAIITIP